MIASLVAGLLVIFFFWMIFLDDHLVVGLVGNNSLVGTKMAELGQDIWSQNLVGAEN